MNYRIKMIQGSAIEGDSIEYSKDACNQVNQRYHFKYGFMYFVEKLSSYLSDRITFKVPNKKEEDE